MPDPLLDTWQIHDRINLFLLQAIPPAALTADSSVGGWNAAQTFAHVHNVRLLWLKAAGAALGGAEKLDTKGKLTAAVLTRSLTASGKAIGGLVEASLAAGGKVKGFKPHVHAFVGYLISHESHHRGQMARLLKANGTPIDKKTAYGIWEWGVR